MSATISGSVTLAIFLLITTLTFFFLLTTWADRSADTTLAINRQLTRVETSIDINSTSESGIACTSYSAQVHNSGRVSIHDFTEMDLIVDYTNSSSSRVATRLAEGTDWSIVGISPDTRDANVWNPGETATVNFTLPSPLKGYNNGTVLVSTPLAVSDSNYFTCTCTAGNTGLSNPTEEAADTGGDNDGYELNPTDAFADAGNFASNVNGDGDRHRFYNYGFTIPNDCAISGIELRMDWWIDALGGKNSMDVELSWDGGASWTAIKSDSNETTTEHTVTLGSSSDTWGHTWSPSELNDSNFRARVTINGVGGRNFFLDWIPVQVYYTEP